MCKGTGNAISLCRSRAAAPPSRVDACVGSYWVLPDAEIGRNGSKAALLPSYAMGENERKCLVPCVQEDRHLPSEGNLKEGRKMTIE